MNRIAILSLSALVSSSTWAASSRITISPEVPDDIPGGAENANVVHAARFAWQEFIALNWPADTTNGQRDVPDENETFGDPQYSGPLVWHTYRHKVETFPGQGDPAGFNTDPTDDFGYDTLPPVYTYGTGVGTGLPDPGNGIVPPCPDQAPVPVAETAFVNLDEVSQIGLDTMLAGAAPSDTPAEINRFPQVIRYLAKTNRTYYTYAADGNALVDGGEPLYTHPTPCPTDTNDGEYNHPYCVAKRNFTAVSNGDGDPVVLPGYVVDFPSGTIMVKAAFRPLSVDEQNSGRFYTTTVRYYADDGTAASLGELCYREAEWGMVGLHIIHKTPTAPSFVFATFEQVDNLLTQQGRSVESPSGRVVTKGGESISTTPGLVYVDGDPPSLTIEGADYCAEDEIGKRLFYLENQDNDNLPNEGYICQNFRNRSLPSSVRSVNSAAQRAIKAYSIENGLGQNPFQFYKLVNVQPEPFDKTEIRGNRSSSRRSEAVFYLANIVVETDYSLQQFSGRLTGGLKSDLPPNFMDFNGRETYQNVLTFQGDTLQTTSNMGGCMGCHGVAQLGGNDFSFVMGGGRVAEPEAPEITPPGTSNPAPDVPAPDLP